MCSADGRLIPSIAILRQHATKSDVAGIGQGAHIARLTTCGTLIFGSLCAFAIFILVLRTRALAAIGAPVLVTVMTALHYQRKLSGVTGDCFGAPNQLAEITEYFTRPWIV
ncbi:MAG: adenosylcobinamide-GDP ribazoletransferase [Acidobacteriota bacterium]|nr:adenosylcobinamide-GDP ribazoletransferase [Acidobacteriota bacterium]